MNGPKHNSHQLSARAWPEVGNPVLVLPLGAIEQHGPHLPVYTDAAIATAVACGLVQRLHKSGTSAVMAPVMNYGASGEHAGFAGTVSLGRDALHTALLEYGRSALEWARRLIIVNGNGGNVISLSRAVPRLIYEAREVAWVPCVEDDVLPRDGRDSHAGRRETSLMLYIAPEEVRSGHIEVGVVEALEGILPRIIQGGVKAVAANGVLGDPTGATAEEGERIFTSVVESVYSRYLAWEQTEDGCLSMPRELAADV